MGYYHIAGQMLCLPLIFLLASVVKFPGMFHRSMDFPRNYDGRKVQEEDLPTKVDPVVSKYLVEVDKKCHRELRLFLGYVTGNRSHGLSNCADPYLVQCAPLIESHRDRNIRFYKLVILLSKILNGKRRNKNFVILNVVLLSNVQMYFYFRNF